MNYSVTLTANQIGLLNLAIAELPEKARLALSNSINAQLQEQAKKQADEAAATAMPKAKAAPKMKAKSKSA